MKRHEAIKVHLGDLERDPLLPPRIVDEERLEALARSMVESGMAQPILVRPAPASAKGGSKYYIVLGYRRFLAAGLLQWQTVEVIVDNGLTAQEVILLAFDAGRTTDSRTPLEDAWYYASMHQSGMTYAAIAEREDISTGKAHMYVRVGRGITSERITAADLDPKHVAQLPITTLAAVAAEPEEEVENLLVAALRPDKEADSDPRPNFSWKGRKDGCGNARVRHTDVTTWSSEERVAAIESLGDLLADARRLEGYVDPVVAIVTDELEDKHRQNLRDVREQYSGQLLRLSERVADLSLMLARLHEQGIPAKPEVQAVGMLKRAGRLLRSLWATGRTSPWGSSIIEPADSMIERADDQHGLQIPLQFNADAAA